ncbi:MAG TPA: UrcA family protein, partial [Steroidobacteraceae bacterium]|nr:UrcA family protein [Steroidobacteraceae bacterium]
IKTRTLCIAVATGLASLAANFAVAAPVVDATQSVVVKYHDLDLSQPKDARKLYARIKYAAEKACGDVPNNELVRLQEQHACVVRAVADAVAAVHSTRLTQIQQAKGGRI